MFYIFLANGFEEVEALVPIDMLRRAGIHVVTVGVGGYIITGTHSITVQADTTTDELNINADFEGLMLPGGMPGTTKLGTCEQVKAIINKAVERSLLISAICAAPSVLGEMGLLKGRRATCFPGFEGKLNGAEIAEEYVCCDKSIITAKGAGVSFEFAFAIIAYLRGKDAADKIKRQIQMHE